MKVPAIRFKGFGEEWNEKAFSLLVTRISSISEKAELPRVEYEDIISGIGELNKNIYQKESLKVGVEFDCGDILFGKLRPYLKNWLLPDFKGIAIGDFWVLRAKDSDSTFIYTLIQTLAYEKVSNQSSGTKMPRSDWSLVSKTEFTTPSGIIEQEKIGSYFQNLDKLISLRQAKVNKLVNLKKAMLEKMFPKPGAPAPEIRFKGFEGAWEMLKLGDVGSVLMNKRIFKYQTSEVGDVPFYKIGTFGREPNSFISRELFEEYKKKYPYPEKGDLLISASGSIGKVVEYTGKDEYFQDSNIIWLQHDNRLIKSFLKQFYLSVKWGGLEGSTIKRLYNKDILDTPIALPTPREQEKIGTYFQNLDKLITLHQSELAKLNHLKKACLEKMFV